MYLAEDVPIGRKSKHVILQLRALYVKVKGRTGTL